MINPVKLLVIPPRILIVLPRLPIVDSTPGAVIYATKISVGNIVTIFSKVSVKICEKQYTAKSDIPNLRFKRSA